MGNFLRLNAPPSLLYGWTRVLVSRCTNLSKHRRITLETGFNMERTAFSFMLFRRKAWTFWGHLNGHLDFPLLYLGFASFFSFWGTRKPFQSLLPVLLFCFCHFSLSWKLSGLFKEECIRCFKRFSLFLSIFCGNFLLRLQKNVSTEIFFFSFFSHSAPHLFILLEAFFFRSFFWCGEFEKYEWDFSSSHKLRNIALFSSLFFCSHRGNLIFCSFFWKWISSSFCIRADF